MVQHEFVYELIMALKAHGIHTAIDTSGIVPLSVCKKTIDAADMLLLDIKSLDVELSHRLTGTEQTLPHERELLEYCEATGKRVWIRHVVVPGLTMDEERLRALAEYLGKFKCIEKIDPLPFHKLGEHKWPEGEYMLSDTEAPTKEEMDRVNEILKK